MIYFVLTRHNSTTIRNYLAYRGKTLMSSIGIIYYNNLSKLKNLKCSVLIFSDLDLLSKTQLNEVAKLYNRLRQEYPKLKILNNPAKVKLRYELLNQMQQKGFNDYGVYRITESLSKLKYPVFLREENNHTGALSELIYNKKDLEKNVLACNLLAYSTKDLLAVEFQDVADMDGIYKKFSALKVQDEIFPRTLDYNMHWMVKTNLLLNPKSQEEYQNEFKTYIETNPHKEWLSQIFEIAGIEYGRIDYGVMDGKPIVWEINLNPSYSSLKRKSRRKKTIEKYPVVYDVRNVFHEKLVDKFLKMNELELIHLKIDVSKETLRKMKANKLIVFWWYVHNTFKTKILFFRFIHKMLQKLSLIIAYGLLIFLKPFGYTPLRSL